MRNQFKDPKAATPRGLPVARSLNLILALLFPATAVILAGLASLSHPFSITSFQTVASGLSPLRPLAKASDLQKASSFWTTKGSSILDENGNPLTIKGINWSGLETPQAMLGGLDQRSLREIVADIKQAGFNTIRVPFSNEMLEHSLRPEGRERLKDESLVGASSLQILDRLILEARLAGLKIVLDNHRSEAGSSAEASGLWYTQEYPESSWIQDWVKLAKRYRNDPTVVAIDLRNEPHDASGRGACWGCKDASRDWVLAAERAGNAILAENPRLLIMVEGTDRVGSDTSWWGGNLAAVREHPVRLSLPGHVVYSVHEYGPAEYKQPWFTASLTPEKLELLWERRWGSLSANDVAPIILGEFGTSNSPDCVDSSAGGSQGQWFRELVGYLERRPNIGWIYWGVNGDDRYGFLATDYSLRAASTPIRAALSELIGLQTKAQTQQTFRAVSLPAKALVVESENIVTRVPAFVDRSLERSIANAVQRSTQSALASIYTK